MLLVQTVGLRTEREDGQGMVEYALIIVLVSVVALVALTLVGADIANAMTFITNTMANAT